MSHRPPAAPPGHTTPSKAGRVLDDPETFRSLLNHLDATNGWDGPEATGLLCEVRDRFAALARKHHLTPDDGLSVAFEVMCQPSLRRGTDPVAVLVRGVVTTLRAWQFADERLCSIEVARRGGLDQVRTERFGDREDRVWEHHPAFTIQVAFYGDTEPGPGHEEDSAGGGLDIPAQADQVAGLFAQAGWDLAVTARIVEAILGRLAQAGSRPAAYESLRRDDQVRTMVDLARDSWTGLLRILLGTPRVGWAHTRLGQGILLRMALGETIDDLRRDDAVTGAIAVLTPPGTGGGGVVA